jgi:trigger factor
MKAEIKKLPKSQIEITFELTAEEFLNHTEHALEHLKEHVKVDGFRKGNVPLKIVEETVGVENLLMEAGDHAVKHVYHDYIIENKLEPLGEPEVQIIKIAKGSPMEFKAKITVLPDIELPNYQELASKIKVKEVSVDENEVLDALNYLQKTRAKFSAEDKPAEKKDFVEIEYSSSEIDSGKLIKDKFVLGEGGLIKDFEDSVLGMKAGEEKEAKVKFPENSTRNDLAGKEIIFKIKVISVQKMELPEINDDFAKTLGAFDTLVTLKESVKSGIHHEKTEEEKQRKRGEILDLISEKSNFEVPETLVKYEEEKLFEDLKNNVNQNFKITFEQYLATIKKTEEELKKTFTKEAEKRIKSFLILREIGKKENIEVLDEEMQEEMQKALTTYTKEQVDKIDSVQLKEYTKGVIYNEKVFQKLESFSK